MRTLPEVIANMREDWEQDHPELSELDLVRDAATLMAVAKLESEDRLPAGPETVIPEIQVIMMQYPECWEHLEGLI